MIFLFWRGRGEKTTETQSRPSLLAKQLKQICSAAFACHCRACPDVKVLLPIQAAEKAFESTGIYIFGNIAADIRSGNSVAAGHYREQLRMCKTRRCILNYRKKRAIKR